MLQWMGGSRRKVTVSRKSTHKRQKQYFEQRKQQENLAESEGHAYDESTSNGGRHRKECRSLDILNLRNLSTVSAQGSPGKFGASAMKYQMPKDPETVITSSVPPSYSVKIKEAQMPKNPETVITSSVPPSYSVQIKEAGAPPSSYQGELQHPKVSFCNNDLNAANNSTENHLSVFDMLINDESEVSSERGLVHEAHVAFSVEGLGKIRTETPLQSPKQEDRCKLCFLTEDILKKLTTKSFEESLYAIDKENNVIFSNDCAMPWSISRQLNSSKSPNYVLHDIELEDKDIPLGGNPWQLSVDVTDSHGNWNPDRSAFSDHVESDSHYRNRVHSFCAPDISYNIGREDICDAKDSYLDDDFIHEREDVYWKYWPHKIDGNSGDFLDYESDEMSDNAFKGPHMLRKRDVKAMKWNSLGLGKIRTETQLHSPKQEGRFFSNDCAIPWSISRQLNASKSSNYVLHDIEPEVDMDFPLGGNPWQLSMDVTNSHGNWKKPNLFAFSDRVEPDSHYRNRVCCFGATDISYKIGREDTSDCESSAHSWDPTCGRKVCL